MKSKCCNADVDELSREHKICNCCLVRLESEDIINETLEEMIERRRDPDTPAFVKPGTYWKVVYECRRTIIYVSSFSDGFFACGQEPLWKMNNINEWIEEVKF